MKSKGGFIVSNFAGAEFCPTPGGKMAVSLPVEAGRVMVVGDFDVACCEAQRRRVQAEVFVAEAVAIHEMNLKGGIYD